MTSTTEINSLSIVIPALNEEDAIGTTISRCLAAREIIKQKADLNHVEIIVVNDGSTDRTAEIAASFSEVTLINFVDNQGYGAAIKHGFQKGTGDILAFLDGDGTCDPIFFALLCHSLTQAPADIVTGSRMHKNSKMPRIRRIGNFFYAQLMSFLTGCKVKDTASGMRVIRKESLPHLLPLPDGLHFTPAMTCRALLKDNIAFQEIEMPYHERQGISKLCIFKDGLRFFLAITEIALTYRPLKFFGSAGSFLILIALLYGIGPLYSKVIHNILPDSSIYRLLTINTLIIAGLTLLSIGIVAERIAASLNGNVRSHTRLEKCILSTFSLKKMIFAGPILIALGVTLNLGPLKDYLTTLSISYHWGYVSTGALLVLAGLQLSALGIFERLIDTTVKEAQYDRKRG
jgi:glycosyltransferase involved in cell wall biosynthesis